MNWREISAVVTCGNAGATLERCLKSLEGVGELIVVDSFSLDDSREIARRHGAIVYLRPFRSAADQKNWALARAKNRWVLVLDSDEEISALLRREISTLPSAGPEGYWVKRKSFYLGKPIRFCGWQRDKVLRLFRRDRGRYQDRSVHEELELEGRAGRLKERIVHRPYLSLADHLTKIDEYSRRGAGEYLRGGGKAALLNAIVHPPFRFLRMYVFQLGLLDGARGLVLCLLSAYGVFLKYLRAYALGRQEGER